MYDVIPTYLVYYMQYTKVQFLCPLWVHFKSVRVELEGTPSWAQADTKWELKVDTDPDVRDGPWKGMQGQID